jgi:NTP pyrophosphatase (non-canonical NTP hydrolase)
MNLREYQQLAERTCPDLGDLDKNLLHMQIGIFTEMGELLDIFKKNFAYGKPIDLVHLGEEIADVCWYQANYDRLIGIMYGEDCKPSLYPVTPLRDTDIMEDIMDYKTMYHSQYINPINMMYTIAMKYDLHFSSLLHNNIEKLKVRYPDKFDAEKALNRDLDAERKELEK